MKWIDSRIELPEDDGYFIVSPTSKQLSYRYVAFYNAQNQTWYYSDRDEVGEIITERVNGWVKDDSIYIW